MGLFDQLFPSRNEPIPRKITFEYEEAYRSGDKKRIAAAEKAMQAADLQRKGGISSLTSDAVQPKVPVETLSGIPSLVNGSNQPEAMPVERATKDDQIPVTVPVSNVETIPFNATPTPEQLAEQINSQPAQTVLPVDPRLTLDLPTNYEKPAFNIPRLSGNSIGYTDGKPPAALPSEKDSKDPGRQRLDPDRMKQYPAAKPKEMLPEPEPTPAPVDPQQQMIEDIKRQRAMLDAIYPQRQTDNPTQTQADDYGLDARERANQMAQLAFFAGITKGAGGSWVGVGEGLAAAGAAHDTGFQRYQQALQDKATRAKSANDTAYSDDAARTNAAVNLYSEDKKLDVARAKVANEEQKDSLKRRLEILKAEEPKLGDFPDEQQQARWEEWRKRMAAFGERNVYVNGTFDATK